MDRGLKSKFMFIFAHYNSNRMKRLTTLFSTCLALLMISCTNTYEESFIDGVKVAIDNGGKVDAGLLEWTREPASCSIKEDTITVTTAPHTDLWQRTYYHFRNDNAPVLQMQTREKYFSFTVRTDFTQSHHRFDQCGIVM